jgi:RNA polymerase sigma factor (sigma-70 family)
MSHPVNRVIAALGPDRGEPTDAELLARFAGDRDAGAFELLVWRHAGLVLRVCRGVLRNHHAAEDAAQAVFLALARQAGSVGRTGSAAGWLFRVARRVATRAARRWTVPTVPVTELDALPAPVPVPAPDSETERVLHEELDQLPERYRAPVLLCFFEGLTHSEAAQRLGVPVGTIAGRVARAKDALAARLARRGVPLAVLAPVVVAVAPSFAAATTRSAIAFATKNVSDVSRSVLDLAQRELRMMVAKRVLGAVAALVVCGGMAFGLRSSAEPPAASTPDPRAAAPDRAPAQKPPAPIIGKRLALAPITTDLQRRLIHNAGPNSTVLLLVDGPAMFKDANTLDVEALQLGEIRTGLQAFRPEKDKSVVHFAVQYAAVHEISRDGKDVLDFTLAGVSRATGFVPGTPHGFHSYHNGAFAFDQYIGPLKDDSGAAAAEPGVGDARALAYPVRTPLSRILTQSVAGVVDIRTALPCEGDDWVPAEVDRSVKAAIGKLKLTKGQRLNFLLNIPKRDDHTQERVRAACKQWAAGGELELWSFGY